MYKDLRLKQAYYQFILIVFFLLPYQSDVPLGVRLPGRIYNGKL